MAGKEEGVKEEWRTQRKGESERNLTQTCGSKCGKSGTRNGWAEKVRLRLCALSPTQTLSIPILPDAIEDEGDGGDGGEDGGGEAGADGENGGEGRRRRPPVWCGLRTLDTLRAAAPPPLDPFAVAQVGQHLFQLAVGVLSTLFCSNFSPCVEYSNREIPQFLCVCNYRHRKNGSLYYMNRFQTEYFTSQASFGCFQVIVTLTGRRR